MNNNLRKIVYKSKTIGNILGYLASSIQFKLLSFYKDEKVVNLLKSVKSEVDFAFYPYEAYTVYSIAKSQSRLEGDMAEVGVYQGGSSKIICEAKDQRIFHLFDTFAGLPRVSEKDTHFGVTYWKDGEFSNTSEEAVRDYLSKYKNVFFHKGRFPETAEPIKNTKFSFVHLDVDLYQSTLDCLEFFYPRLIKGGVILTHDYHTNGVQSAFKEYFQNKSIPIIELTGSQCFVVNTE